MSVGELPLGSLGVLLPALYAEVHYRHGRAPSLLHRRFPEVLVDVPLRVEPGWENNRIPVLMLVKDAHLFPVTVESLRIDLRAPQGRRQRIEIELGWDCSEPFEYRILPVELGPLVGRGRLLLAGEVRVRDARGRRHRIRGDSYGDWPTTLRTRAAAEPYPHEPGWSSGDLHHHSSFTNDQVEFGAPPEVTAVFADAAGCGWAALTDHSYDLDDDPQDFLFNRPEVPKWHRLRDEVRALNRAGRGALLLAGEEVSCGGAGGQNLHLLAFGHDDFLPGAGDGAERWFYNAATFPLEEQLRRLRAVGGVAYAAHPCEEIGWSQRLGFNRGTWGEADFGRPGVAGLQIWNGMRAPGLEMGLPIWKEALRAGKRLALGAGNDAHGDYCLGRSIGLPFISLSWGNKQVYARARTSLRLRGPLRERGVLDALGAGRSTVTNGPFLALSARQGERRFDPGELLDPGRPTLIEARARSTAELGLPERLQLHVGEVGKGEWVAAVGRASPGASSLNLTLPLATLPGHGWIRAELHASRPADGDEAGLALSNPLWIGS